MTDVARGRLYIGEQIDAASHERQGTPVMLAASDFTTHGVIVGMTGSGKTGLGLVLVEEALLSGVPALIIDPKGDLTNLALTFPELRPADFRPWINEGDAARAGATPDEFAVQEATKWREGLASWGVDPGRIAALRSTADITIYTPGSTSGVPLNLVGSLQAPKNADAETIGDEVEGFVSGLLGLVDIDADPLSSREHILLSNIVAASWTAGRDLDLATLVGQVQQPAGPQARRLRGRHVLPAEGPHGARAAPQWPAGLTVLRRVDAGRAVRHRPPADVAGWEARRRDRDDRAPV